MRGEGGERNVTDEVAKEKEFPVEAANLVILYIISWILPINNKDNAQKLHKFEADVMRNECRYLEVISHSVVVQ